MKKYIIIILSFLCIGALRTQTGYFGLKYSEKVLSVDDGAWTVSFERTQPDQIG